MNIAAFKGCSQGFTLLVLLILKKVSEWKFAKVKRAYRETHMYEISWETLRKILEGL